MSFRSFFIGNSQAKGLGNLNPLLWADKEIVHSGGLVSQWTDRSGNGNHLIASIESIKPDYSAAYGGSIYFDGTNTYLVVPDSEATFKCLHDGTGATIFINLKFDESDLPANRCMIDTGGSLDTLTGQYFYINFNEDIGVSPSKSVGGQRVYSYVTAYDSFLDGNMHFNRIEYEHLRAGNDSVNTIDGANTWGGETTNAPTTADATNALRLGLTVSGSQPFKGNMNHISIFDRILTATEIAQVEAYINSL